MPGTDQAITASDTFENSLTHSAHGGGRVYRFRDRPAPTFPPQDQDGSVHPCCRASSGFRIGIIVGQDRRDGREPDWRGIERARPPWGKTPGGPKKIFCFFFFFPPRGPFFGGQSARPPSARCGGAQAQGVKKAPRRRRGPISGPRDLSASRPGTGPIRTVPSGSDGRWRAIAGWRRRPRSAPGEDARVGMRPTTGILSAEGRSRDDRWALTGC